MTNEIGLFNLCGTPLGDAFGIGNCFVAGTRVVLADDSETVLLAALPGLDADADADLQADLLETVRVPLGITCVVLGAGLGGLWLYRDLQERRRRRRALFLDLAIDDHFGPDDPDDPTLDDLAAEPRGLLGIA